MKEWPGGGRGWSEGLSDLSWTYMGLLEVYRLISHGGVLTAAEVAGSVTRVLSIAGPYLVLCCVRKRVMALAAAV